MKRSSLKRRGKRGKTVSRLKLNSMLRELMLLTHGTRCIFENTGFGPCAGPIQMGHLLPKGSYRRVEYLVENVRPKCARHHIWAGWHKDPMMPIWFENRFPGVLDTLRMRAREMPKRSLKEVAEDLEARLNAARGLAGAHEGTLRTGREPRGRALKL